MGDSNTIQGMISNCLDNANRQFDALGNIATNISRVNTIGYKGERFEQYIGENGIVKTKERRDFSTGTIIGTQRPLDIAIDGPGFIPVTKKDGSVAYTRDGTMSINSQGYLVTPGNDIVGDGIKIPMGYQDLKIAKDGTISVSPKAGEEPQTIGKISLVNFNNPEGLKLADGNKYVATEESGKPVLMKDHNSIKQSCLEQSNVSIYGFVDDTLRIGGSFVPSTKLAKYLDDLYSKGINFRQ